MEVPTHPGWPLLLLAVWSIIAIVIARSLGFFRWREREAATPPSISFVQVLSVFLVAFLLPALFFTLMQQVLPLKWKEHWLTGSSSINALPILLIWSIFLLVLFCWWLLGKPKRWHLLQWGSSGSPMHHAGVGLFSWLLIFPVSAFVGGAVELGLTSLLGSDATEQVAVSMVRRAMESPFLFAINAVGLVFAVPITEELLFRGFLYNWLRRKIGVGWGIALSALLFALFHLSTAQGVVVNMTLLFTLSLLGVAMAYLYERQRSLWAPIGLHAGFNAMSILALIGGMG